MAKNNGQPGAVVAFSTIPVQYEGTVTSVTNLGVKIITRAYGKQTDVERFFAAKDIIAHSDEGEGFVVANENRAVATYHGDIVIEDSEIVVTLENGRAISFLPNTEGPIVQIHFDAEDKLTSTEANIGKRNSAKLLTAISRREEKSGSAKKSSAKKAKKK